MRVLVILSLLCVVALSYTSASPQPSDSKDISSLLDQLIRNSRDTPTKASVRPVRPYTSQVKGHTDSKKRLHQNLRKGEYVCGENMDRICRLRPGQEPPACNGICQYPV